MGNKIQIKHIILKESFDSHKELEKLTVDIFKSYIAEIIDEKTFIIANQEHERFPKLWLFTRLSTKNNYHALADFIQNFRIMFEFKSEMQQYATFSWNGLKNGNINVHYDFKHVVKGLLALDPKDSLQEQIKDMYYHLYSNHTMSAILHELQHAYDYYRTGGKMGNDKKSKAHYKAVGNSVPSGEDYNKYLKLQHEIDARFTQAMNLATALDSVRSFVAEFQTNFKGWNVMTPKVKKVLLRRASQFYYKKIEDNKKKGE